MNASDPGTLWLEARQPLAQHHEEQAFPALAALLRGKRIIAACFVLALVLASVITLLMPDRYTAEAAIQASLARDEQPNRSGLPAPSPGVQLDAASMIDSEVRVIRSRTMAERVVARLDLTNDPAFVSGGSLRSAARDYLLAKLPFADPRSERASPQLNDDSVTARALSLLRSLWPGTSQSDLLAVESKIALELMRYLTVKNDTRSYLINLTYTSTSPERSALIANAFAEEYLRSRSEAAARHELAALSTLYGQKHPAIQSAQSKLDEVLSRPGSYHSAAIALSAEPPALPSSPNRPVIIGLAGLAGMALGGLFILFLERRNHGFRTDTELTNATNVPCLAMLPETTKAPSDTMSIYAEAARAITAATGLVTKPGGSKVVLVTSCLPDEGKTLLCAVLAGTLVDTGRRTLIIDLSPQNKKSSVPPAAEALEEVIKAMEGGVSPLRALRGAPFAILHRSSGDETSPHLVTSPVFSKLLTEARDIYDIVLIEVPPVMLVADALYLGRSADVVLHVVRWNRTPRLAVAAALRAIRNLGIRVDAMVLSRVDPAEYRRYTGVDPRRYFRPRRKYLPARSPEQLPAKDEKPKLAGAASGAL